MGSHPHQVAILVPHDKLDCFGLQREKFVSDQNGLAFYPGPVLPPWADGSPFSYPQTRLWRYDVQCQIKIVTTQTTRTKKNEGLCIWATKSNSICEVTKQGLSVMWDSNFGSPPQQSKFLASIAEHVLDKNIWYFLQSHRLLLIRLQIRVSSVRRSLSY